MGALLHFVGNGADHQIATEAQRWVPAIEATPSEPQLVRGSIRQSGNLSFDVGHFEAARFAAPVAGLTDGGRRLARMLASRCIVGCGSHALAGSAMR
jgi:hypothetical protein